MRRGGIARWRVVAIGVWAVRAAVSVSLVVSLPACASRVADTDDGVGTRWDPPQRTSWQIQLSGELETSVAADMYIVDLFDVSSQVIDELHRKGRHVICYFSAGTWEDWRPDAADYPTGVLGHGLVDWPGERWVDVRRLDILEPILGARLDLARHKGCEGVDPDNVDGFEHVTGFEIGEADQLRFNRYVAREAHARSLAVGLKNDLAQIAALVDEFDFAVNEQCFVADECDLLDRFVAAGKPVFEIEYEPTVGEFCPDAIARGFNALRKSLELGAEYEPCL